MIKEKAQDLFEQHNPYGTPLANHCIRLANFATALAQHQDIDHDADLIHAGAFLHDIGLLVPNDDSANYLFRGVRFVAPYLDLWELDGEQITQMNDMLLYNHSFRSVPSVSPVAEVFRCAVQVEHSVGQWSHGLERQYRKDIFARYPRSGLNHVLVEFSKTSLKRDGVVELVHLFFPKHEERHNES